MGVLLFHRLKNSFGDIEFKVQSMIQFQGGITQCTGRFIICFKLLNGITMYSQLHAWQLIDGCFLHEAAAWARPTVVTTTLNQILVVECMQPLPSFNFTTALAVVSATPGHYCMCICNNYSFPDSTGLVLTNEWILILVSIPLTTKL